MWTQTPEHDPPELPHRNATRLWAEDGNGLSVLYAAIDHNLANPRQSDAFCNSKAAHEASPPMARIAHMFLSRFRCGV